MTENTIIASPHGVEAAKREHSANAKVGIAHPWCLVMCLATTLVGSAYIMLSGPDDQTGLSRMLSGLLLALGIVIYLRLPGVPREPEDRRKHYRTTK